MVLNRFGESDDYSNNQIFSRGTKGDPGIGFKLTSDGNYNIENKRLCNTQDPEEDSDVCTKGYVSNIIKSYENKIQEVDNKNYSETSKLNAALITKFNENNLKIKEFSDNTERFINLKYNTLNKKLENTKDDLNKAQNESINRKITTLFLHLHKAVNDLFQVFANNTNKIVKDNYSAINKKSELTKEDFLDFVKTYNTVFQIFAESVINTTNLNHDTINRLLE